MLLPRTFLALFISSLFLTGCSKDDAEINVCADADGDTVCDSDDICADGDDTIDGDGDTVPDACDVWSW